jgi:hypothetical protein
MLADNNGYQNLSTGLRQNLGVVDLMDADPGSARRLFLDSLDTAGITGVKSYVPGALLGLALAAGADGDPAVAATLHGVADRHYEQAGRGFEAIEAGLRDRDHARLRATLGDAAFEAVYARGRTLSQAEAVDLATAAAAAFLPLRRRHTVRCRNESGRSWRCWPAGRPTPRSPGNWSCRSTPSGRIWSGSGTRPAPGAVQTWPAMPSRPASTQLPLPPESRPVPGPV